MGMIGAILGAGGAARQIGEAVGGAASVLVGDRAEQDAAQSRERLAAVAELGAEFAGPRNGAFDAFVDGLNRLPRPLLALGTLGLFVYAMAEPAGFSTRMQGLALVPEPLWWLLGAVVSFYFGARELHHKRIRTTLAGGTRATAAEAGVAAMPVADMPAAAMPLATLPAAAVDPDANPAVEEWRRLNP